MIGQKTREVLINHGQCPPFSGMGIRLAGISWASREFCFVRSKPDMMQALVAVCGEGRIWKDGTWLPCRAGHAYLTPAGQFHAYRAVRNWQVVWVTLDQSAPFAFPSSPCLQEANPEPLAHIVAGLHLEVGGACRAGPLEHWSELLRHALLALLEARPSRLWRLWKCVQENPETKWTLSRLAQTAALGAENLRLICRRELGCSPMQQVTRLRMQYASSLLRAGQKVEFTATRSGYENPYAFSTAFKRTMGVPPGQLRNRRE